MDTHLQKNPLIEEIPQKENSLSMKDEKPCKFKGWNWIPFTRGTRQIKSTRTQVTKGQNIQNITNKLTRGVSHCGLAMYIKKRISRQKKNYGNSNLNFGIWVFYFELFWQGRFIIIQEL
jgi:hypothetical protein